MQQREVEARVGRDDRRAKQIARHAGRVEVHRHGDVAALARALADHVARGEDQAVLANERPGAGAVSRDDLHHRRERALAWVRRPRQLRQHERLGRRGGAERHQQTKLHRRVIERRIDDAQVEASSRRQRRLRAGVEDEALAAQRRGGLPLRGVAVERRRLRGQQQVEIARGLDEIDAQRRRSGGTSNAKSRRCPSLGRRRRIDAWPGVMSLGARDVNHLHAQRERQARLAAMMAGSVGRPHFHEERPRAQIALGVARERQLRAVVLGVLPPRTTRHSAAPPRRRPRAARLRRPRSARSRPPAPRRPGSGRDTAAPRRATRTPRRESPSRSRTPAAIRSSSLPRARAAARTASAAAKSSVQVFRMAPLQLAAQRSPGRLTRAPASPSDSPSPPATRCRGC